MFFDVFSFEKKGILVFFLGFRWGSVSVGMVDEGGAAPSSSSCWDEKCAICLGRYTPETEGKIKDCKHSFCYDCISQWVMKSSSAACPLCKVSFTAVLYRVEGVLIEEAIECPSPSPTPSPEAGNDNLECLDHSFCLEEIGRLIQEAERKRENLLKRARPSQSRYRSSVVFDNASQQRSFDTLGFCIDQLESTREHLHLGEHFDSTNLMMELHQYQEAIVLGKELPDMEDFYGNDSSYDEGDYDDDYYEFDQYCT